ncbi:MAG: thiamine pyrophosphate-dependent enzyme [Actinomycetota bacterium]
MAYGHTACAGCGEAVAARTVAEAAGPDVIITNATGCLEVFTTRFPRSSWQVPWIHSLFENAASVASGVEVALKALGRAGEAKVIAQGGDGATADIGIGAISGMLERGHDILYVCYDTEVYSNTGYQRSGLTPLDALTTTSPAGAMSWGNATRKKDLPQIFAAHGAVYVATSTAGFPNDITRKVKKALSLTGPRYLQIHCPCVAGWGIDSSKGIRLARMAVNSGLYPIFEMEEGVLTRVRKIKPDELVPVVEYLKEQKRFSHLFKSPGGRDHIEAIQLSANSNIERYGLMS